MGTVGLDRVGSPATRVPAGPQPVVVAFGLATVSEWALWVPMLVLAFDRGGTRATGLTSLALLLGAAAVSLVAGSLPDGPRPNRLFAVLIALQALLLVTAAVATSLDAPLVLIVLPSAGAACCLSLIRPAAAVILPALVRSPAELTRANVRLNAWEAVAMLAGPLAASGAIAVGGFTAAYAVAAAFAGAGALLVVGVSRLPLPAGRSPESEAGARAGDITRELWRVAKDGPTRALLAVIAGRDMVVGALDILIVVLAMDALALGDSGAGWLTAVVGAGALAGSAVAQRTLGRPRLAPVLVLGTLVVAGAFVVLAAFAHHLPMVATSILVVGLATALVNVAARILLQRAAPQDAIASLFSVAELVSLAATALGSLVVQVLTVEFGVTAGLVGVAVIVGAVLLAVVRPLTRIDATADAPVVAIRLFRRVPVFAALPAPALEAVARAARPLTIAPGETIIREGDRGEDYYVIVSGEVDVFVGGVHRRTMGPDQGFGEIALLSDIPRTAGVVARGPVEVLAVGRAAFLTAVTGHDASRLTAWAIAQRYEPGL